MRNLTIRNSCPLMLLLAASIPLLGQTPKPEMENDQVRVLKVTDQPHQKSSLHDHKLNRVMIYLTSGRQEVTPQGGKTVVQDVKAGDVKWSPAGGMHVSEVTSNTPLTIIELEIKKPGDATKTVNTPLDPLKVDPTDYKLEFENSQVRVIRVRMAAKRQVPLHEHTLNRAVVYLTDQSGSMTSPGGQTQTAAHKAGEVSWAGPTKHSEANLLDKTFEGIVVEFKN
jgi:quercetin dioxygenase-like cupin family protein